MFNRYMVVIVLLNVDVKLLAVIVMGVYMAVKVAKLKVWSGVKGPLGVVEKVCNRSKKLAKDKRRQSQRLLEPACDFLH